MTSADYRIESSHPLSSRLMPTAGAEQYLVRDRALAVALAAKSFTRPSGQEIRVVHVPTGEIVFRKASTIRPEAGDEA
ncbi:MAG: hypothetical protein LH617_06265 [Ramlibacter sp.]|nr:hypothetical protein [Ramlibacter sp.]